MIIGEFSDSFVPIHDGVGRVVKAYCDTLAAMGEDVYAIAPKDPDMGYSEDWGYKVIDFSSFSIPGKVPFRMGVSALDFPFKKRLNSTKLDICHAHDPGVAGQIAIKYARKHNVPLVGTFHSKYYDDVFKVTHSRSLAKVGADFVVAFYNKCDEVWSVSDQAGATLQSYGYKGTVHTMINGTTLRTLDVSAIPEIREKFRLPDDGTPILLFVGQQSWKKNILRILESSAIIKNEGLNFRLVFAGRGPDEEKIKAKAEHLGLAERTVFTGHIQDTRELDALYAISSLFLFPSLYDTSGLVLREAAAMGTPGIVVRGSCAAETVEDRVNGLLCEDDSEDMARLMKEALTDSDFLASLGQKAKETIPQPWKGKIMERVIARYRNLVGHD